MGEPQRIYAVGDVHGHLDKLIEIHERIDRDRQRHGPGRVVHIGDLVDRGPDSCGVIDYMIEGMDAGEDWVVLKGNHERMMLNYLMRAPQRDPRLTPALDWLHPRLGGGDTLASYGLDLRLPPDQLHQAARAAVPLTHVDFLQSLPLIHQAPGLIFVHAGLRPNVPLTDQTEDDLLWIRDEFHFSNADFGALVVHGHTPVEDVLHYGNRLNIDTGAAYGGPLSAVVIEAGRVFQLSRKGRREILPPRRPAR